MNPARQASGAGGLPVQVPALTVNRVCGSGAQAIPTAALEILSGYTSCAIAGGMENMYQASYLMAGGRWGYRMGDAQIFDSMLRDGLNDAFSGEHSGWHTEDLVSRYGVTREASDPRLYLFFTQSEMSQAASRAFLERVNSRMVDRDPPSGEEITGPQAKAIIAWCATKDPEHAFLKTIRQPVPVVNGSNDIMLPTQNSYVMFKHLKDAKLILLPVRRRFRRSNDAIADRLSRCRQAS